MKLIREEIENVEVIVEERNGKKSLYIEGVFLQGDIKNRNGRMYPAQTLAKEVASNRIALIHTIEKPLKPINRNGEMIMGGQKWLWEEEINKNMSNEFYDFTISVRLENKDEYTYTTKGFIFDE